MSRRAERIAVTASRRRGTQPSPEARAETKSVASSEVAQLRGRYGLSREKFSRLSGFSVRGLANTTPSRTLLRICQISLG